MFLQELFPFRYNFLPQSVNKKFNVVTSFLFLIKNILLFFLTRFKYLQIIRKLYLNSLYLSAAFARTGTILPIEREITRINKYFIMKSRMCKKSVIVRACTLCKNKKLM
jgi:hypothetical protein